MSNPDIKVDQEYVETIKPNEVLQYMAQMGQDLTKYAHLAQAMLAEAKEKGIPVDLSNNKTLQKFKPDGEYEVQLVKLRSELMSIGSAMFEQGVKITQDLRARIQKMGL